MTLNPGWSNSQVLPSPAPLSSLYGCKKGLAVVTGPKAELLPPSFRRTEPACFRPHHNRLRLPKVRSCLTFCGPGAATAAVGMIHRREGGHGGKEPGQLSPSWRQRLGSVGEAGPRVPEFPVPKAALSPGLPGLERKDSEIFLPDRLTGKEAALEEVRRTRKESGRSCESPSGLLCESPVSWDSRPLPGPTWCSLWQFSPPPGLTELTPELIFQFPEHQPLGGPLPPSSYGLPTNNISFNGLLCAFSF